MSQRTTSAFRAIIKDYKERILQSAVLDEPAGKQLINFRDDISSENKRDVHKLPLEYLLYRFNNSRINAEVLSYIKGGERLEEINDKHQKMVGDWLAESDEENMTKLANDLRQNGQIDVAICTCDGFLINGNRRRKALEILFNKTHDQKFNNMKVVVLPSGENDKFGTGERPSLIEIQQIEYACQVQATGKSDYSGINTALLYKINEEMGYSLEAQLKNDPQYSFLTDKQFNSKMTKIEQDFLLPLAEVDAYLTFFKRKEQYISVSQQAGKEEGRWQAFIDWSKIYRIYLKDDSRLMALGLEKKDVPKIRSIAFKIIRQRELGSSTGKVHGFMRSLKNILEISYIRKDLFKIDDNLVPPQLPKAEQIDSEGKPLSIEELDKRWRGKYGQHIINCVKKCKSALDHDDETNKPVTLLETALAKLVHEKMHTKVSTGENNKCMQLCDKIIGETSELLGGFDQNRMMLQKLKRKNN